MNVNLQPFIEFAVQNQLMLYNVVVRHNGSICNRFSWRPDDRVNLRSATKSVTSLAMGIAVNEGLISLQERISEIFLEDLPEKPSPYLMSITIKDMLMMAGGQDEFLLKSTSRDSLEETNWVRYGLSKKFTHTPGTRFVYSNLWPYLCSVIIQKRTGQTMLEWLKPRFFTPLSIRNPQWLTCPRGITLGMGSLLLNAEEMSKIGQLCLNGGVWEGKQLIPREWIEDASSCHISTSDEKSIEGTYGYGYYFWKSREPSSYMACGAMGQSIIVLPEHDAVVSTTAYVEDDKRIVAAIWDYIVPELQKG